MKEVTKMKGCSRSYYDVFVKTCGKHPRNVGVRHYVNFKFKLYTYSELYGACEYMAQILFTLQIQKAIVGVISDRNPLIPCIIAAIHKNSPTFIFLDPNVNNSENIKALNIGAVISVTSADGVEPVIDLTPTKQIELFDFAVKFYRLHNPSTHIHKSEESRHIEHSYIMFTSGSTGEPKQIQVPTKCLEPNITDLTNLFNLNSSDVIYFSTPMTFDPSMVEILLACTIGASLLISPDDIDVLFSYCDGPSNSVTFWQTTPSKFFHLNDTEITHVLGPESNLKVLALGGEPLNHIGRLKKLKAAQNKTKIYCMYGVTEMSCWATIAELQLDKVNDEKEIPLGNCMSETRLELTQIKQNVGKILLGSDTRQCKIISKTNTNVVVDKNGKTWIDTGDLGSIMEGTIYFRGRMDDIVKRFGNKINLTNIEKIALTHPDVKSCCCIWLVKPQVLVLYYASETVECTDFKKYLFEKLNTIQKPDKIIRIGVMPLNKHGKINKNKLTTLINTGSQNDDIVKVFIDTLLSSLPNTPEYDDIDDKNFMALGGNSFMAITICNYVSMSFPYLGNCVLPLLLSHTETIGNIVEKLKADCKAESRKSKRKTIAAAVKLKEEKKPKRIRMLKTDNFSTLQYQWSHDTGKCVDANPTYYEEAGEGYVVVGSHSGQIAVLNAKTGVPVGVINHGSRIEAGVLCISGRRFKPCGLVGSYDGTIICFDLRDCSILWNTKVPAMIKSKACLSNRSAYLAAYDGFVRSFDLKNGVIQKSYAISKLGISADLLATKDYVIVGTLVGICACIDTSKHVVKWKRTLNSPIFSSPSCFEDNLLIAEVGGIVHCLNVNTGEAIWKFTEASGNNIFSSIVARQKKTTIWQIIFGCHDKNLYCVTVKNGDKISLRWKTELASQVYSSPCLLNCDKDVVVASSCGKLYVVNCDSGKIGCELELPSKIFSSPTVNEGDIYIGCRDDTVYAVKYTPAVGKVLGS